MSSMEQARLDGYLQEKNKLENLQFVQDRIEGLEEQEYEFTKEFLPKFFKTIDDKSSIQY